MEYLIVRPDTGRAEVDGTSRDRSIDELVLDFLGRRPSAIGNPKTVDAVIEDILQEMPAGLDDLKATREWARPPVPANVEIDLCGTCDTLNEGVEKGILYVLLNGITIPRPNLPQACMDEIELDPSTSLPMRCCMGCGHVMNGAVTVRKPTFGTVHDDVCCQGMQEACARGIAELGTYPSFTTTKLTSHASAQVIRIDHCPWCGMWAQLLHHARQLGHGFLVDWDRRHSRSSN